MSNPWIPTYPGAWDRLFANTVSGAPGAQGSPDSVSDGPLMSFNGPSAMRGHTLSDPMPMIVGRLAAAVGVLQLADNPPLSASSVRDQLIGSANSTINQVLEDYCGTPPRLIPWPWPGPPPWVFSIVAELSRIANTAEAAGMQQGLLKVAGRVLERSFGRGSG